MKNPAPWKRNGLVPSESETQRTRVCVCARATRGLEDWKRVCGASSVWGRSAFEHQEVEGPLLQLDEISLFVCHVALEVLSGDHVPGGEMLLIELALYIVGHVLFV